LRNRSPQANNRSEKQAGGENGGCCKRDVLPCEQERDGGCGGASDRGDELLEQGGDPDLAGGCLELE
jgi:hypothetical protein